MAPPSTKAKLQKLQQQEHAGGSDDAVPASEPNNASSSSASASASFDYRTRLKAVGRIVSNHPTIHDTVAKTLETCKQRAPPGMYDRDKMLAASVRMKVVRKTIDRIIEDDKSMDALMAAYRDISDKQGDPTNESLREALSPKHAKKIDDLIVDAARDTRGAFERDSDGFFETRKNRMQEKDKEKEEAAHEKAAAASSGGRGGKNDKRKGRKRGATEEASEDIDDDGDGRPTSKKMPSPLRGCSEQELVAIGGAKKVADQYEQLSPLGKRMFECFVSAKATAVNADTNTNMSP